MCDPAVEVGKTSNASRDPGCPVANANTEQEVEKVDSVSVKHPRDLQEHLTMSLQRENRWIREAVEPSFSLKPLEYQVKHALDTVETKDGTILLQALAFDTFQTSGTDKKKKHGQSSQDQPPAQSSAPYFCELCNRKFTRQSNLTEHMLRHTGKVYECDICFKKFSCVRYLTRHTRLHTGEHTVKKETQKTKPNELKTYVCIFCNKKFSCKSHLVAHTRIHTGVKPYPCEVCSKTFNHKSHLTAHTRIHTGERPFHCRICQKQFRDPSNLAGHMRVHNGQKPFACQYCSEQFSHRSQLKKHERSHVDGPASSCPECGKTVTDASKLICHMKVHNGSRSNASSTKFFACNFCNGQFETKKGQDRTVACEVCTKQLTERMKAPERVEERTFMIYAVGEH